MFLNRFPITYDTNLREFFRVLVKTLRNRGLQNQLAPEHPLIAMFRKTLDQMNGENKEHTKNYCANVSRVLAAIDTWLLENGRDNRHWSSLLTAPVEAYRQYFDQ